MRASWFAFGGRRLSVLPEHANAESGFYGKSLRKDGVADGIRTRNNKLHKLGLYH